MSANVQGQSGFTLCVGSTEDFCSVAYSLQYELQPRTVVRMVRGKNMTSAMGLFNEFAAALQFPCYFGNNWNAFDECIADLEWLPGNGYLIMIVDGSQVLRDEPDELAVFFRIMRLVAQEWAEARSIRFQILLQCTDEELEAVRDAFAAPVDAVGVSELKSLLSVEK